MARGQTRILGSNLLFECSTFAELPYLSVLIPAANEPETAVLREFFCSFLFFLQHVVDFTMLTYFVT